MFTFVYPFLLLVSVINVFTVDPRFLLRLNMSVSDNCNACGVGRCREYVKQGIQCDSCGVWYHQRCSGLTKKIYQLYTDNKPLKWICAYCVSLAEDCKRILRDSVVPQVTASSSSPSTSGPKIAPLSVPDVTATQTPIRPAGQPKKRLIASKGTAKPIAVTEGSIPESSVLLSRLEKLEEDMRLLRKEHDNFVGKSKNLLLHNCVEPVIREAKARRVAEHRQVQAVFRLAGLPTSIPYVKCHRVGLWRGEQSQQPRPILVVFTNNYSRDLLLSKAATVEHSTRGVIKITPDSLNHMSRGKPPRTQAANNAPTREPKHLALSLVKVDPLTVDPKIANSTPKANGVENKAVKVAKKKQEPATVACCSTIQPRKNKRRTKPLRQEVTPIAGPSTLVVTPQNMEDITDPAEGETWATVVSGTPVSKPPASKDSPQVRTGDWSSGGTIGASPAGITVLKNGIVCRVLSPMILANMTPKNSMTPRVLRPRVSRD